MEELFSSSFLSTMHLSKIKQPSKIGGLSFKYYELIIFILLSLLHYPIPNWKQHL